MPTVSIDSAAPTDRVECARLLRAQLDEHGLANSPIQLLDVVDRMIADSSHGFILVARFDDRVVGMVFVAAMLSAEHGGPIGWLEELFVEREARSQGVGTALVNAALVRAAQRGMVAIELEVDATHYRAATLYQRLNFRPLDRARWVQSLPGLASGA